MEQLCFTDYSRKQRNKECILSKHILYYITKELETLVVPKISFKRLYSEIPYEKYYLLVSY